MRKVRLPTFPDKLDRDALVSLFAAGLTQADVASAYALHPSRISQLARAWGINSRAIRARTRSLAVMRPDLAQELLPGVSGRPGPTAQELTLGSGITCLWRCRACKHEWQATVANRALRRSGCPACARTRLSAVARGRAMTPAVGLVRPDLVIQFMKNLTVPSRDVHSTPAGSHDRVRWRCRAGHEWDTSARQRIRDDTHCPICRAGLRSSRLEFDVAELLMASTGLTVRVSHTEPRTDRADVERIDLLVEEIGLLIDLDPSRWHRDSAAVERDSRKLIRLSRRTYAHQAAQDRRTGGATTAGQHGGADSRPGSRVRPVDLGDRHPQCHRRLFREFVQGCCQDSLVRRTS